MARTDFSSGSMYNKNFMGKVLEWSAAWNLLFTADCQVLQILDCCNAAEDSHEGAEMLAAISATDRNGKRGHQFYKGVNFAVEEDGQ